MNNKRLKKMLVCGTMMLMCCSSCSNNDYRDVSTITLNKLDGSSIFYYCHDELLIDDSGEEVPITYHDSMNDKCEKKVGTSYYASWVKDLKTGDIVKLFYNDYGEKKNYYFSSYAYKSDDFSVVDNYYVSYQYSEKKHSIKVKKSNGKSDEIVLNETDRVTVLYKWD